MLRTALIILLMTTLAAEVAAAPPKGAGRVFTYRHALRARDLAQRECKPLVVHFVPDTATGAEQITTYYRDENGITEDVLDDVVVVVVPTERFSGLARQLGIKDVGGYRTISAYDLSAVDDGSVTTCRSGFV